MSTISPMPNVARTKQSTTRQMANWKIIPCVVKILLRCTNIDLVLTQTIILLFSLHGIFLYKATNALKRHRFGYSIRIYTSKDQRSTYFSERYKAKKFPFYEPIKKLRRRSGWILHSGAWISKQRYLNLTIATLERAVDSVRYDRRIECSGCRPRIIPWHGDHEDVNNVRSRC